MFNVLRGGRKVPLTAGGMAIIRDVISDVCQDGVRNGGLAPGIVPDATRLEIRQATGNDEFDGNLSNGYLVWSPPVSTLSASDRSGRRSPAVNVWLRSAGAVHSVRVNLTLEE